MRKPIGEEYMKTLRERGKEQRVTQAFQQTGLDIAEILGDAAHKALYIKLAKEYDFGALLALAKDVAERHEVKNKGAYFMKLFSEKKSFMKNPKSQFLNSK